MIKLLLTTILLAFAFSGCVAPRVLNLKEQDIKDNVINETYKVENVSVQIIENSKETLESKFNELSIGRLQQLHPKAINYSAMESSFSKYFKNVSYRKSDLIIESKVTDFTIGAYTTYAVQAKAKVKINVKIKYQDKLIIDKDYIDNEENNILATKEGTITHVPFDLLDRHITVAILDIYQEQVIPDLLKALKKM